MRLLILSPYYLPHLGGTERYIQGLYTELIKQYPDTTVDLICYNTTDSVEKEELDGINIYRVPCIELLPDQFALPNYSVLLKLLKKLKSKHRYDVVHAHNRLFESSWWAWIVAKWFGAESHLTDHCAEHPWHSNKLIRLFSQIIDSLLVNFLPGRYDSLSVVSQSTAQLYSQQNRKRAQVLYAGINQSSPTAEKKNSQLPKFKKNEIVISYVGRIIESKHPLLLAKVAQHFRSNQNLHFVFCGTGHQITKLERYESSQIHILGQLPQHLVHQLLKRTNIFILPTEHHEGIPISLIEAGYFRCAAITSGQGGIRELIKHQKTGLLIEPNYSALMQSLTKLINQPEYRENLANNLHQVIIKKFNWQQTAKKYWSLLPQTLRLP